MSFIGGLVRTVGAGIGGLFTGGPLGAATGVARSFMPQGPGTSTTTKVGWGLYEKTRSQLPQGFGGISTPYYGPVPTPQALGAGCPAGMRLNRSTYVTRGGGTSRWPQGLQVHPKGTECVTRRKINPGNGRAAVRAVRRLVAFHRLTQRVERQLRKAAGRVSRGRGRMTRALPPGRGVTVVDTD